MLSYYPAFTFCNTLIYYIYTLATPNGTVLEAGGKARKLSSTNSIFSATCFNTTNRSKREACFKESSTFNRNSQA